MTSKSNNNARNIVPQNSGKGNAFDSLKRNFENTHAQKQDTAAALMDLATAVAYSVINTCIDPQRKHAAARETVCAEGFNPTMVELKRGIAADLATLNNTRRTSNEATRKKYNTDGDEITVTDRDAAAALAKLADTALTDGIDLVQTAACAILEQAAEHASGENWLDTPYTVRRLSKRVYIKTTDSAAYRDEKTTPMQEVYRAVRRAVASSRAVQTDPRNGYTYIEDYTEDGLDTIYIRMGKYADIGGYNSDGNYTAGIATVEMYESIVAKLNLTASQATVLKLREQGHGYKAIATYLGVTPQAVRNIVKKIQKKAGEIGLTPNGYNPNNND